MNAKSIRKPLVIVLFVALLLFAFSLVHKPNQTAMAGDVLDLQAPSFVDVASAGEIGVASIEDEAGISAYFQASTTINLDDVRDAFRTIETETTDYIIGSVAVGEYPESEDVHVYVHTDGWILAYYLAADPVGKIFDWRAYHDAGRTSITTKLENTLAVVASEAGVAFSSSTYYDFRYPNATHLMLIVEWVYAGTDSCEVNLPGSFAYYERSWSFGSDLRNASYKLDGVTIKSHGSSWSTSQGTLTAAQLLPDQFHTIEVYGESYASTYAYGGLALVYKEQ